MSALLIPASYAEKEVIIDVDSLVSKPYVNMTLEVLKFADANIVNNNFKRFEIVPDRLKSINYKVEGDYSSASFLMAMGAISGKVKVKNLREDSIQADRVFVEILKDMGCSIKTGKDSINLKSGSLDPVDVSLKNTPDLFPPLAVCCSFADGKSVIRDISHLEYKESNRIEIITKEFRKIGVNINRTGDAVEIEGKESLKGGETESHGDHRVAMALFSMGTRCEMLKVMDFDCTGVSYPNFLKDAKSIGVNFEVEV